MYSTTSFDPFDVPTSDANFENQHFENVPRCLAARKMDLLQIITHKNNRIKRHVEGWVPALEVVFIDVPSSFLRESLRLQTEVGGFPRRFPKKVSQS